MGYIFEFPETPPLGVPQNSAEFNANSDENSEVGTVLRNFELIKFRGHPNFKVVLNMALNSPFNIQLERSLSCVLMRFFYLHYSWVGPLRGRRFPGVWATPRSTIL